MNTSVSTPVLSSSEIAPKKRGCLFYVKRGLKWIGIILVALIVLGVSFQTVATEIDRRTYSPHGQLYSVNGHRMHLVCEGKGSPTVVLEAGGGAESLWWHWVQNQVAVQTQVCAYDRPGLGWSEAVTTKRDPVTIVGELHMLLNEADVQPPYIMVGHSYGAILARVYAWQYPQDVRGLTLVDSYTVGLVEQSELDNARLPYYLANSSLYVMQWLGVSRIVLPGQFQEMGYPSEIIPEMVALHARNQTLVTDSDEKGLDAYVQLARTSADANDLGDKPLAVLWASESYANYDKGAMQEVAAYSSNSITRVIADTNHGSILGGEPHAQQVTDTILDVIEAAQTHKPLAE